MQQRQTYFCFSKRQQFLRQINFASFMHLIFENVLNHHENLFEANLNFNDATKLYRILIKISKYEENGVLRPVDRDVLQIQVKDLNSFTSKIAAEHEGKKKKIEICIGTCFKQKNINII